MSTPKTCPFFFYKFKIFITARKIWKGYLKIDKKINNESNLTFDQFYNLSQQNCFYCNAKPKNKENRFIYDKSTSEFSKENGWFIYNGLDRLDNLKNHNINNIVPCCIICNFAKRNMSLQDFYKYINRLKNNIILSNFIKPKIIELPKSYLLSSIKSVYKYYIENSGKMEIDLQTFYSFSQNECFYCGIKNFNCHNVYLKKKSTTQKAKNGANFYYNGIDRIDNSKDHSIDNIVPCCKNCNYAKNNLSFDDFIEWIKRIKEYQNKKSG